MMQVGELGRNSEKTANRKCHPISGQAWTNLPWITTIRILSFLWVSSFMRRGKIMTGFILQRDSWGLRWPVLQGKSETTVQLLVLRLYFKVSSCFFLTTDGNIYFEVFPLPSEQIHQRLSCSCWALMSPLQGENEILYIHCILQLFNIVYYRGQEQKEWLEKKTQGQKGKHLERMRETDEEETGRSWGTVTTWDDPWSLRK